MKKKKIIIVFSSYLLASALILGGFIYKSVQSDNLYKRQLDNTYQRAFAEFVTCVGEIDMSLQKSRYAMSPQLLSSTFTEIFGKATSAQMAMGQLPFSSEKLEVTGGFITRVGDYSFALSKKTAAGEELSEEEKENLNALCEVSTILANNLTQLYADLSNGMITMHELRTSKDKLSEAEQEGIPISLTDSFNSMSEEFPEVPVLIYDGPFSEHISGMTPLYLEGESEISENDALKAAAEFVGLGAEDFVVDGTRDGQIPVYLISRNTGSAAEYFEITRQGGKIMYMVNSRLVQSSEISTEKAVEIAKGFLEKKGFDSMRTSYWIIEENVITVNFAFTQNNVICYSDLIKISVALDNGDVVGFEAQGYIMSHFEREIPTELISEGDASEKVSTELEIQSHHMAVIPTSGKYEVFCHEFKCENADGQHYIVYVNAQTGAQEKILVLLEDENGTLTM